MEVKLKKCSKCGRELPATTEYFHKSKSGKYGLYSICKECVSQGKSKYYLEHAECIKSKSKVHYENNKEYCLERVRQYNIKHKEEKRIYSKNYRLDNADILKNKRKKYIGEHRDIMLFKMKQYRENNKEKIKIMRKEYAEKNKERVSIGKKRCKHKRRAISQNSINTLTSKQWEECLKFFSYKDAYTGLPMKVISQDHIIPVSKGGAYVKQNIIPCEITINSSKNNSDMELWFKQQSFFSEERLSKIYKWMGVKDNTQQLKII